MEEEEEDEEQCHGDVCCFEELVVSVSTVVRPRPLSERTETKRTQTHRIAGKDMKVKYAWGISAATPVQYVTSVFHCLTISPLSIWTMMKGKVWINARTNMA